MEWGLRGKWEEYTRLKQIQICFCVCVLGKGVQQSKDGSCLPAALNKGYPSSLWPEAMQLSFSLYTSGTFWASVPPLEPMVSTCKQESVRRSFKRMHGFLAAFCLTWMVGILADFYSHMFCGLFFLILVLWFGEPGKSLGPPYSSGRPLQLRDPSCFSTATLGCGASPFYISIPPINLDMTSSLYP